jgi:hypothetical protein
MSWLQSRNDMDADLNAQQQSPVFKAMMERASKVSRSGPAPAVAHAHASSTQAPTGPIKQVRFATDTKKPYTPTSQHFSFTPDNMDLTSYGPMVLSGLVLAGTYFLAGGSGTTTSPGAPVPVSKPVVIPGLGAF